MLLLTDSISKEDSCWELRLRCGELGTIGWALFRKQVQPGTRASGGSPWAPAGAGGPHVLTLTPAHPALSLFLMAVNIKTPVVVENITLMCLRILQKLIKPPAPTSKKNKVL